MPSVSLAEGMGSMSFRQWNAVVALASSVLGALWLAIELSRGFPSEIAPAAMRLVWMIGALVVLNIVGIIVAVIWVGIATREALRDEKADERDRHIGALAMRNAYCIASAGGALFILALALGVDPVIALHGLFAALLLAGATEAGSTLIYYRIG
jgi:hypothetical protein